MKIGLVLVAICVMMHGPVCAAGEIGRGVRLGDNAVGVKVGDIGIAPYQSFSVAFKLRVDRYPDGGPGSLLQIECREGGWPKSGWGYFWNRTVEGGFANPQVDGGWGKSLDAGASGNRLYVDYDVDLGSESWSHLVYVFEYNRDRKLRMRFYLNGMPVRTSRWVWCNKGTREYRIGLADADWSDISLVEEWREMGGAWGEDDEETRWCADNYPLSALDWIKVGGHGPDGMAAIEGVIDDFQVWGKAVEAQDVKMMLEETEYGSGMPAELLAFWDFEADADADGGFGSRADGAAKAYCIEYEGSGYDGGQVIVAPEYAQGCLWGYVDRVSGDEWPMGATSVVYARQGTVELLLADGGYVVEIYDLAGALVAEKELYNAECGQVASVPVGRDGVYLVRVKN